MNKYYIIILMFLMSISTFAQIERVYTEIEKTAIQ
jgi:hypothetical protein